MQIDFRRKQIFSIQTTYKLWLQAAKGFEVGLQGVWSDITKEFYEMSSFVLEDFVNDPHMENSLFKNKNFSWG